MKTQNEKKKMEEAWNKIRAYILETKPELWDEDLDTTFRTLVID